ncbi:hypothetical protein ATE67_16860 [Sphingopyxis sp. H050]|jgi:hypothetical protein|uniref:hypothetical protein n=1 Tax=Sphingopyxis sp. H050 TaxID=1759072 RepID=UPI000736251D|nr:hypothetical protein [Sphingopyxis sp. H050]KTE18768.1 hypothetical protein ATE67_16860 [Sphingopyxis sp. H050]
MEVTVSDVMAVAAFGLSAFALWRQRKSDDLARHLNQLLIQKETGETVAAKKGELSANFVNTGKSSYQFRIYNRGKGSARNIRFEILDGEDLFRVAGTAEKFPYPSLEPHQAINLPVRVHMQSPRRATVKLAWDDDAGGGEKTITDDVF